MIVKKVYRDSVTTKAANAPRKDHSSWKKANTLGADVKHLCGQEGDVRKAKEKRDTPEKERTFLFIALKRSRHDEFVISIF